VTKIFLKTCLNQLLHIHLTTTTKKRLRLF